MYQELTKNIPKCILLLVMATIVLPVWGKQVDENTARQVASLTLSRAAVSHETDSITQLRASAVSQKTVQLLYKSSRVNSENENTTTRSTRVNTDEIVYFYVFGGENNKGFVIVSGDDRVKPVLGYSYSNGFPVDDMPPNLQWWLGEYAKQIEYAIENDLKPTAEVKQHWTQYLETDNNEKEE